MHVLVFTHFPGNNICTGLFKLKHLLIPIEGECIDDSGAYGDACMLN